MDSHSVPSTRTKVEAAQLLETFKFGATSSTDSKLDNLSRESEPTAVKHTEKPSKMIDSIEKFQRG